MRCRQRETRCDSRDINVWRRRDVERTVIVYYESAVTATRYTRYHGPMAVTVTVNDDNINGANS